MTMQIGALIVYLIIISMGIISSIKGSQKVLAAIVFGSLAYSRIAEFYNIKVYEVRIGLEVIFLFSVLMMNLGRIKTSIVELAILALLMAITLAGILDELKVASVEIFINGFLGTILTYFITKMFASKGGGIAELSRILKYAGVLTFLYAIVQPIINGNIADYLLIRASSFYYSPTIFGSVAVLLLPFVLNDFRTLGVKIIYKIAGIISIMLSGTRGAIFLMMIQVAVHFRIHMSGFGIINKIKYLLGVAIFGCVIVGSLLNELTFLFRRFLDMDIDSQGSSLSERVIAVIGAIELMVINPIFGVGLGRFEELFQTTEVGRMGGLQLMHAHNFIMNVGAEQGIIAACITLAIMIIFIRGWVLKLKVNENVCDHGPINDVRSNLFSIVSYTIYIVIFGGEYLHKMSATPMILYAVVAGFGRRW